MLMCFPKITPKVISYTWMTLSIKAYANDDSGNPVVACRINWWRDKAVCVWLAFV